MQEHLVNTRKLMPTESNALKLTNIICSGLIAISLIIIQDYVSSGVFTPSGTLDTARLISLLGFAMAIPLLAGAVASITLYLHYGYRRISDRNPTTRSRALPLLVFPGIMSAFVGIAAAFWQTLWLAGLLFITASLAASILSIVAVNSLESRTPIVRLTMYTDEAGDHHEIWEELPDFDGDGLVATAQD